MNQKVKVYYVYKGDESTHRRYNSYADDIAYILKSDFDCISQELADCKAKLDTLNEDVHNIYKDEMAAELRLREQLQKELAEAKAEIERLNFENEHHKDLVKIAREDANENRDSKLILKSENQSLRSENKHINNLAVDQQKLVEALELKNQSLREKLRVAVELARNIEGYAVHVSIKGCGFECKCGLYELREALKQLEWE